MYSESSADCTNIFINFSTNTSTIHDNESDNVLPPLKYTSAIKFKFFALPIIFPAT